MTHQLLGSEANIDVCETVRPNFVWYRQKTTVLQYITARTLSPCHRVPSLPETCRGLLNSSAGSSWTLTQPTHCQPNQWVRLGPVIAWHSVTLSVLNKPQGFGGGPKTPCIATFSDVLASCV